MSSLPVFNGESAHCSICGLEPSTDIKHTFICEDCLTHKPHFDFARHALPFDGVIRKIIHDYKYHKAIWLKNDLVDILEALVRNTLDIRDIDLIIPVPLSKPKFILRGFNQSAIISKELAKRLSIPYSENYLIRINDTPTQTHLGIEGRKKNIKGAFKVVEPNNIRERRILIVDDVMTTGTTLNEIATILKHQGAQAVWGIAIARAPMGK